MNAESVSGMTVGPNFLRTWLNDTEISSSPKYWAVSVLVALAYFGAGKLGLSMALVHVRATAAWPSSGIALAAFLLLGYPVWPSILFAAFLISFTITGSVPVALGIAIGSTAEGLAGAYLANRFAQGLRFFNRSQNIFKFVVLTVGFSTAVGATIAAISLLAGGSAGWVNFWPIALTWWLGDAVGIAITAPLLLPWFYVRIPRWRKRKYFEAAASIICLVVASLMVFGDLSRTGFQNYPLEFLCIPFLLWSAFRFRELGTAVSVPVLSGIAIWGTAHGYGPFVRDSQIESLLLLQAFLLVISVMTIAVAGVVSASKWVEVELRKVTDELELKVVTDPLTGLANYRRLEEVFKSEAERSRRTGRSFALLLLDLNGLKKINDTYGHLVGSQAICRVAVSLRFHSRGADTAARYGGDEFAVLLPETGAERARAVATRITERVADDDETPPISVSIGIAVYPEDGETIEEVFKTADAALYRMKKGGQLQVRA